MTILTLKAFKPAALKSWFKSSPERREKALLRRYPEFANLYPHERGQALAKKTSERNRSIYIGLTLGTAIAAYTGGATAMESGMIGLAFGFYIPSMAVRFLGKKPDPAHENPKLQKLGASGVAHLSLAKHFSTKPESHPLAASKFSAKAFRDEFFIPLLGQHHYIMLDFRGAEVSDKWLQDFATLTREFLINDELFNTHTLINGSNELKAKLQHYMKNATSPTTPVATPK